MLLEIKQEGKVIKMVEKHLHFTCILIKTSLFLKMVWFPSGEFYSMLLNNFIYETED